MCVGLLLARLGFLCVYCAASSVFALASSSNRQTLLLLCTMVRVKRRAGTAVILSRTAAARLSACVAVIEVARLSACVAVVEVARLNSQKLASWKKRTA